MLEIQENQSAVIAEKIVADLQGEIALAEEGQRIPPYYLPSLERKVHLLRLKRAPISNLLVPDSGSWPLGSEEAEEKRAVEILLGNSRRLLNLTPERLSFALRLRRANGSYLDIEDDKTYTLSLLTIARNFQTGEQLYYTMRVGNLGQRRGVKVSQRLHSRNVSEIIQDFYSPSTSWK